MTHPSAETPTPQQAAATATIAQGAGESLRRAESGSMIERAARRLRESTGTPPSGAPAPPGATPGAAQGSRDPARAAWAGRSARQDLDFAALERGGFVTPDSEYSALAEQFRIIKRPVLIEAFRRDRTGPINGNVVMVTSARPGEGKTFVACNLALSIAQERDYSVLLVDADVRHPSVVRTLGLHATRGLTDLLADPTLDPGDVMIRAANLNNLAVIPAGSRNAAAPELFASQGMARLLDELARRYADRVTIIDTPPALASSEPSVISLHAGQALLVVEAERTNTRAVRSTLALIGRCPSISLVLNKARGALGAEEFGHYGYAYAQRDGADASRKGA
jgi:receptor protein-tyrosine kinase